MTPERNRHRVMAMHQPNYIPWLGYFYKIAHCDVFVYLDAVQYPRGRSVASRNEIKTPQGRTTLTIPVSVPRGRDGKASYGEIEFADVKWRQKHLRALETNYRKAPHFQDVHPMLAAHIESAPNLLSLNIGLIEDIAKYLELDAERVCMSTLGEEFGQKTDLIAELCRATGSDTYLSGTGGGRDYNDESQLESEGIQLVYSEFEPVGYAQLWGEFEPRLSIVDSLYNHGRNTRGLLGLDI
ncbi:WbqC family protein [Halospina sp. K52047b]|uniref:WbqC family protein n=1 Tax=Halospina sp. K52047b TaxID=2614160 RepID=UPI001249BF90|nr:WbqC family protein [Halospina sp. K52047b]KAA8976811.1 WbqC family protein [Halospina sp. K52047b]